MVTIFCYDLVFIVMFFYTGASLFVKKELKDSWVVYFESAGRTVAYCLINYVYWITCVGKDQARKREGKEKRRPKSLMIQRSLTIDELPIS